MAATMPDGGVVRGKNAYKGMLRKLRGSQCDGFREAGEGRERGGHTLRPSGKPYRPNF